MTCWLWSASVTLMDMQVKAQGPVHRLHKRRVGADMQALGYSGMVSGGWLSLPLDQTMLAPGMVHLVCHR